MEHEPIELPKSSQVNKLVDACRGAVAGLTLQQGQHSMHMAAVVLLLVNGELLRSRGSLRKQELALATDVLSEGRALMLVVNKLDACTDAEVNKVQP